MNGVQMKIIARIHTAFPDKFGVPRQSGLVPELQDKIVFEPEFRNPDAVRCIEDYSHLWLIWQFSKAVREDWSPTVRPPRLGGNTRIGVFASRSPFRPNALGLSSVKLEKVEMDPQLGPVLYVSGVDMMDGTPIFDIKPYLVYADSHPDATGGLKGIRKGDPLQVIWCEDTLQQVPEEQQEALRAVLQEDPRPRYQEDPQRVYGMTFAGQNIKFRVEDRMLYVLEVEQL
ncbi:MAG: tRNA (N6-threonylcarbamoyladenosine(37)-N6)-methyltransferase TrmO [Oscillospiraceae bacterium]|nr:tRNA (N6-threonylcarbamoyladenosine(37)-N6)-methyltransferase TrmO [Oscillospiraceae bacterium]